MLSWRLIVLMSLLSCCLPKQELVETPMALPVIKPLTWKSWHLRALDCGINQLYGIKKIISFDDHFDVVINDARLLSSSWVKQHDDVWRCGD